MPVLQLSLPLPTQTPPLQMSICVHTSPSLQVALLLAKMQPLPASQLSVVQGFWSSQGVMLPAKQTPPLQLSPVVHTLLSLQLPLSSAALLQPVFASQLSLVHGFLSSQTTSLPTQLPLLQLSPVVHALPSSQAPGFAGCWHSPAMQLS